MLMLGQNAITARTYKYQIDYLPKQRFNEL